MLLLLSRVSTMVAIINKLRALTRHAHPRFHHPRIRRQKFHFLATHFTEHRNAIRDLTHRDPEFVFWIFPDGRLHDARRSHRDHVPKAYEHILDDEPDYGGFLRGRVVRLNGHQLIVVYCRSEALAEYGASVDQLIHDLGQPPVPIEEDALVISDNADLYRTVAGILSRR